MSSPESAQPHDAPDDDATDTPFAGRAHAAPTDEPADLWADIVTRLSEVREYASYYVSANLDRLRFVSRAAAMWTALGVVGGIILLSIVAAASALFVVALGTGAGKLLGDRVWLGQLLVSGTILLAATGGTWLVISRSLQKYHRQLIESYETRKQHERTKYGTDVEQRAKERSQNA